MKNHTLYLLLLIADENKKNRRNTAAYSFFCRDDWIRTSDNTPPRRVL